MRLDPLAIANPGVRGLRPYEPGKPLEALAREYGIRDAVKLASNENPLGPSPKALEAVRAGVAGLARYPEGNGFALKQALAANTGVAVEQVTLGNGSNEVLELVARTFAGPANEVIFSEHAFVVYALVTQAIGARAVATPARAWGHDLEAMTAAVNARTRLIFIANPNNPTGTWLTAGDLKAFIAGLPEQVLVVVDEAYFEYVAEPDYPDCSRWLAEHPNLIVTRTFSKVYGLAGLRMGYALSSPTIAELLNRVRQPFNVNSLALRAAEAALGDEAHLRESVAANGEGMRQLTQAFSELGLAYIPSVANFVSLELGRSAAQVYEALLHEGVIVRPVANYGMPRHLRVTVGTAVENRRFIEALKKVLAKHALGT